MSQSFEDDVVDSVCRWWHVKRADLIGRDKHQSLAHARSVAMYLMVHAGRRSYREVALYFGRNHKTVITDVARLDRKVLVSVNQFIKHEAPSAQQQGRTA